MLRYISYISLCPVDIAVYRLPNGNHSRKKSVCQLKYNVVYCVLTRTSITSGGIVFPEVFAWGEEGRGICCPLCDGNINYTPNVLNDKWPTEENYFTKNKQYQPKTGTVMSATLDRKVSSFIPDLWMWIEIPQRNLLSKDFSWWDASNLKKNVSFKLILKSHESIWCTEDTI